MPNYDSFFDNVFIQSQYSNDIWGHQFGEETALFNRRPYTDNLGGFNDPDFKCEADIPTDQLISTINYFRNKLYPTNISQKLMVWEAHHNCAIHEGLLVDAENSPYNSSTATTVINSLSKDVVYFEGSYFSLGSDWLGESYLDMFNIGPSNRHYLGSFPSIDFAKTRVDEVHDVINIKFLDGNTGEFAFNTFQNDESISNSNYMWFKAYTSIIHGVDGIWFWQLTSAYDAGEKPSNYESNPSSFLRSNFPLFYQEKISNLARELRFLADQGYLIAGDENVIFQKKDHVDENCIVPPATEYIPENLPDEKRSENYGLRYTVRSNGEDLIMIITNPLQVALNATLDFSSVSNNVMRKATEVEILFNDENDDDVSSLTYKVDRDSGIDLASEPQTVQSFHTRTVEDGKIDLSFGPLDVHVIKFSSDEEEADLNGWEKAWTNHGGGPFQRWGIDEFKNILPGDYDGDGSEELLCVDNANEWIIMLDYQDGEWRWKWSNNGEPHYLWYVADDLTVGDFDGDGKDEIFGDNDNFSDDLKLMFDFESNDLINSWIPSTNSNELLEYDEFFSGNFNGDQQDELLAWNEQASQTTVFIFNGNDFINIWSNNGISQGGGGIGDYSPNFKIGDIDNDSKDEVIGLDSWATIFEFGDNGFHWGDWSTYGGNSFGGWTYPLTDEHIMLVGDIDNVDEKEEVLFLSTGPQAEWAASLDFESAPNAQWHWNWSANPQYSIPFINDWPLSDGQNGSETDYLLVKALANEPEHLLAKRKIGCNYLFSMYKSIPGTNKSLQDESQSLPEKQAMQWSLYPNPSNGMFSISFNKTVPKYELRVLDLSGIELFNKNLEENEYKLNLSRLSSGIYILELSNGIQTEYKKIIIN